MAAQVPHSPVFMRCVSFCTAAAYDLPALANSFKKKDYIVRLSRDVLHLASSKKMSDIFIFNHGSFICWGLNKREELQWIEEVKPFSREPLPLIEVDHFCFRFGEETSIDAHDRFKVDIITLDSDDSQIKLAISYGLAQSIKLETFEEAVQQTVRKNSYLPEEIAHKGVISLSRRSLFKRIGEIFVVRSSVNLNSEYLDTPEYFWRTPNVEPFYIMTKKFLDVSSRVTALNQKLDVLQELLNILSAQLQHSHSSMLESIIIILILIEIAISLLGFGFK